MRAAPILLTATLALFGDVLFLKRGVVVSMLGADLSLQFAFWRDFGFGELRRGNLALWNPHIYSGTPFFGGLQPALLYPPNWIHLALPLHAALNIEVALHVFLLGLFTFAWIARRGVRRDAAVVGAALAMFGGATFTHVYAGHLSLLAAAAWTPLVFLAVDRIVEGRARAGLLVGAPAVALQLLAGHPQTAFTTAVAAALLLALSVGRARRRARAVVAFAAVFAGGAALSAAQLLAGLDAAAESTRGLAGLSYAEAAAFSFPLENLMTLIAPKFFGFGLAPGGASAPAYWGRCYSWEMTLFVGVAGLFLALYAVVGRGASARAAAVDSAHGEAPAESRRMALLVAILLVLALGAHTPLFRLLHAAAPGFRAFRGPSKFIIPASVVLAFLAAAGLERLARAERPARGASRALLAAALLLAVGGAAVRAAGGAGPDGALGRFIASLGTSGESYLARESIADPRFVERATRHAAGGLWVAGAVALALAAVVARARGPAAARLVGGLAVAEVLAFALATRPTFLLAPVLHPAPLVQFHESHPGGERVLHAEGEDNAFLANGVLGLWGYDPNVSRRYAEFMYFTQGVDPDRATYHLRFTAHHPLQRMLRWRYLVSARPGAGVREFDAPLPRALLVGGCVVAEGRDAVLSALAAPAFDPERVVVLESPPDPAPEPRAAASDGAGVVRVTDVSTDEVLVEAETDRPAILVLTDAYSAGWRAVALPGSAQAAYDVVPANYVLRGVPLAAGRHRLRLEYAPRGYRIGKWISLAALAGFVACAGAALAARSRVYHPRMDSTAAGRGSAR